MTHAHIADRVSHLKRELLMRRERQGRPQGIHQIRRRRVKGVEVGSIFSGHMDRLRHLDPQPEDLPKEGGRVAREVKVEAEEEVGLVMGEASRDG